MKKLLTGVVATLILIAGISSSAQAANLSATGSLTEGPYYLSGNFVRSDITEGQTGLVQNLTFTVVDTKGTPLKGVRVDIWHANALGQYSGVSDPKEGCATCASKTFLRGTQTTNSAGKVTFKTIFAGWYPGRTVHYHVKVWKGSTQVLTTQYFVTSADSAKVYKSYAPYTSKGLQNTSNAQDMIANSLGASGLAANTLKNTFANKKVTSTAKIVIK